MVKQQPWVRIPDWSAMPIQKQGTIGTPGMSDSCNTRTRPQTLGTTRGHGLLRASRPDPPPVRPPSNG
jgi:hypothetical protein